MSPKVDSFEKSRVRSSQVSVVVSTSLVLFMLGMIGILMLSAENLSRYVKENFVVSVTVSNKAKETQVIQLKKYIEMAPYVKEMTYVTKEEATERLKEDLGEQFMDFIGYNPLSDKIEIKMISDYVNNEELEKISAELMGVGGIESVDYDRMTMEEMNANIAKINLWFSAFAVVFLIISLLLISSYIRLVIYSKRFTIKTMQYVGATKGFITAPFLKRSIVNSLWSVAVASLTLAAVIYGLVTYQSEFSAVVDWKMLLLIFVILLVVSLLMAVSSTYISMRKFLKMKIEDLYY